MRPNNPIDTPEQRQHERLALSYFHHPAIIDARERVAEQWLDAVRPSAAMRGCFERAFTEVMFGATVWALNQDPLYPRVITISRVAHSLQDESIPGSRWGIDNPDSIYRVIPVTADACYRIRGRVARTRLVENYFTLWNRDMQTVGLLSGSDLKVDAQGYFEISVDSSPADGRVNHIHLPPDAHEFYIRDVIHDWADDRPNELSVERLGNTAPREPFGEPENIRKIQQFMERYAANTTRWNRQALDKQPNRFEFVIDRDSDGALRGQLYILGRFLLEDAQTALVLDVDPGGAAYFIAPVTNVWGTTNDIITRNGSLNNRQAIANADGTFTFVLSIDDPGVHNWLDPEQMPEGILTLRWAEFQHGEPAAGCGVRSRLTRIDRLSDELPVQTRWLNSDARRDQLAKRAASYRWRVEENS